MAAKLIIIIIIIIIRGHIAAVMQRQANVHTNRKTDEKRRDWADD